MSDIADNIAAMRRCEEHLALVEQNEPGDWERAARIYHDYYKYQVMVYDKLEFL